MLRGENTVSAMALFDPVAYGKRLKSCRESAGMTQFDLAIKIGERQMSLSRDERGSTQNPPMERIEKAAKVFDVDPRWLLLGDSYSPSTPAALPDAVREDPPGLVEFLRSPAGKSVPPKGLRLLRQMLGADDPTEWDAGTWRGMWLAIAHIVD